MILAGCSSSVASVLTVLPDLVDERLQLGNHGAEFDDDRRKRVLGADGFLDPVRSDRRSSTPRDIQQY